LPRDAVGRTTVLTAQPTAAQLSLPPAVGFGDFPAHFSPTCGAFDLLIPAAANENLKDFELLVGASPDGEFRSIGKFQSKNLRMMKTNGWQEFKFEPVTAKYFKFRALSLVDGYGGGLIIYEIRLMGFMKK
jgi:hypothetical protein